MEGLKTAVIRPTRGLRHIDLKEIWRHREILYFLTWRDIKIRYKETLVGVLWAVIQPVLTMAVFSLFFGRLAKVPSGGLPYPLFVYAGLLPWTYFSQALTRSSESVVENANMIRKVYFPRVIIPVSASFSALIDFLIASAVFFLLMLYYGFSPVKAMILFPALLLFTFLCSAGIGLWLASLNVMYRDVRHAIPFFIKLGLFVTPVIYPASMLPKEINWILYLNPMAGVIETFRASILADRPVLVPGFGLSVAVTIFFFITGLYFFRKTEKDFADII